MSEYLYLRMEESGGPVEAAVLSAEGRLLRAPAKLALQQAAALAEGRRVAVIVPSNIAVVLATEIPKTSAARQRTLLPFALEDQFATDIENLHFSAGATLADGRTLATVVQRNTLDAWLDELADAGIFPQSLYSACDGIPETPSTTVMLIDGDSISGRRPDGPPFQLDGFGLTDAWDVLNDEEDDQGPDSRHALIYASAEGLDRHAAAIDTLREQVPDLDLRELRDRGLPLIASTLIARGGTNLLQGDYAPKSNVRAALKPWVPVAALAAGFVAVAIISAGVDFLKLRSADGELTERTAQLCSQAFGTTQSASCQSEARRQLTSAGQTASSGQASFLGALAAIAGAVDEAGFDALSYRNGTLDLEMVVSDVAAIDELSRQIDADGRFQVRPLSNTPDDAGLRTRLQVTAQ